MDLQGRRVLLTGASRGIGVTLAENFAAAGAQLALVARDADALADVAQRVEGRAYPADLTDADQLRTLIGSVESDGGPVDVLVNNAGTEAVGSFLEQSAEQVEHLLRLNLLAPAELSRQVLPGMVARGHGHLVMISSLAAVGAFPGLAAYGASKAGLTRLAAGIRADVQGSGVGVTDVQFGPIRSEMIERIESYAPTSRAFARLRRLGVLRNLEPTEVAAAVVDGVLRDRAHVRLPRRAALTGAWAEAPQQFVDGVLRPGAGPGGS